MNDSEIAALTEAIDRMREHAATIVYDCAGKLPPCECEQCRADVRHLAAAVPALLRERGIALCAASGCEGCPECVPGYVP